MSDNQPSPVEGIKTPIVANFRRYGKFEKWLVDANGDEVGLMFAAECINSHADLRAKVAKLEAKLELAREGLRHYAKKENWYCNAVHVHDPDDTECYANSLSVEGNGYTIAAATLDGIEKEK